MVVIVVVAAVAVVAVVTARHRSTFASASVDIQFICKQAQYFAIRVCRQFGYKVSYFSIL